MWNINYRELQELLKQLYPKEQLTINSKSRNYQSNGKLYIQGIEYTPALPPLPWEREFLIGKHPHKEIYAYSSISDDRKTSFVSLFEPTSPNMARSFNVGKRGYNLNPRFSPDGNQIAFISGKDHGVISLFGDVIVTNSSNTEENNSKYENITKGTSLEGICFKIEWKSDRIIRVFFYNKGRKLSKDYSLIIKTFDNCLKYTRNRENDYLEEEKMELCSYITSDNTKSYYWFAHPNKERDTKRSLLLCQGGPHHAWLPKNESGAYNIELLQHLGYSIIMPIVHGMPGISKEFDDQVRGDWGGQCINDYLSALDTAIEKQGLDKNKVAVLGHSFGGFCAYSMNVRHPDRFRCVVSESGPFNLESFYDYCKNKSHNDTIISEMHNGLDNPDGEIIRDKMFEQSPHRYVNDKSAPILIIHGEDDKRVPCEQSKTAAEAFNVTPILYQGEEHSILTPQNIIDRYIKILTFLDKNMK